MASSLSTRGHRDRTPRSVQMLDKLRNGLEEYVRLYNPITTNWRELKLRGNKGKNRIKIVGIDDDDTEYSDYEDELQTRSLMDSSLSIENDNILAPLFLRQGGIGKLKRGGSLENLRTPVGEAHDTLGPLSDRGFKRQYGSIPSSNSIHYDSQKKDNIKTTLQQMGALKQNMSKRLAKEKFHLSNEDRRVIRKRKVDKELSRRMSERRLSLSVIKESPTKFDVKSSIASPTKDINEEAAPVKTGSSDKSNKSKRSQLQKKASRGSLEEYSTFGISGRRGAKIRKRKAYYGNKFRRYAKFFIVLIRLWRSHSMKVNEMLDTFDALDALVGNQEKKTKDVKDEIVFDVSYFKCQDEARIPREAKRILQAKPGTRSQDELHYLKIALRNYQAIVEYPMHMQVMLSERAWYEGFDPKRVIVREGHAPLNFYFILSGAVIVSKYDHEKNINKTVTFLGKGDSFGDLAILKNENRETTVITKEKTEFLVISADDFREIFMSGGLGNPKDPFLNSLWYLKGWPLSLLGKNQKKAIFNFYKRDLVMCKDTGKSDWIYIVKSGSLSLYKELRFERPDALAVKKVKRKKKKKDPHHEDKINTIFESQMETMHNQKAISRLLMQPLANELNIPKYDPKDVYGPYGHLQHQVDPLGSLTLQISSLTDKKRGQTETESGMASGALSRERSSTTIDLKNKKQVSFTVSGAILTKSNMKPLPPSQENTSEAQNGGPLKPALKKSATEEDIVEVEPEEAPTDRTTGNTPELPKTQFITVQTLIKGAAFGLADVVYGAHNMPSFSLVSNGAEVVMIEKKLFEDNASQRLMTDLREEIYPYPSDEALQDLLKRNINWDYNCKSTFTNTLYEINKRNASVHDARSELAIKKPAMVS